MPIKIAINGLGRIGRAALKIALTHKNIKIVAINDLMNVETLAHLIQYDSVYGTYEKPVRPKDHAIEIAGRDYAVLAEKDPTRLPWKKLGVDVVLECTGFFTGHEAVSAHLAAGAKKVIISAPAKDEQTMTLVFGTDKTKKILQEKSSENVISNASCTTNCISPVIQVLESSFGVSKALMTTVHSYTADQSLVDGPHKDLRRARGAAQNIVPTSTGAALATTKVVPSLKDIFDGISIRVPTPCVSLSDITCVLKKPVTVDIINQSFILAATMPAYKNILAVTDQPLVSSDFKGSPYSAIVDLACTRVSGGDLIKVLAWYDNEYGYSCRLVEMAEALFH